MSYLLLKPPTLQVFTVRLWSTSRGKWEIMRPLYRTVFSPAFLSYDKTSPELLCFDRQNSKDALNILLIFPELFNAENIEFLPVDVGQQPI